MTHCPRELFSPPKKHAFCLHKTPLCGEHSSNVKHPFCGPLEMLIEPQAASTCDRTSSTEIAATSACWRLNAWPRYQIHVLLQMPDVHCCRQRGTCDTLQKILGEIILRRLLPGSEPFICGHSPGACRGLYPYRGHACHHGAASGPLAGGHAAGPYACSADVVCL